MPRVIDKKIKQQLSKATFVPWHHLAQNQERREDDLNFRNDSGVLFGDEYYDYPELSYYPPEAKRKWLDSL